jgi:hypothetical protein
MLKARRFNIGKLVQENHYQNFVIYFSTIIDFLMLPTLLLETSFLFFNTKTLVIKLVVRISRSIDKF